jgi:hypothetical protein
MARCASDRALPVAFVNGGVGGIMGALKVFFLLYSRPDECCTYQTGTDKARNIINMPFSTGLAQLDV